MPELSVPTTPVWTSFSASTAELADEGRSGAGRTTSRRSVPTCVSVQREKGTHRFWLRTEQA